MSVTPTLLEDLDFISAQKKLCTIRSSWLREPPSRPEPQDCNDCFECEWNATLARVRDAARRLREEMEAPQFVLHAKAIREVLLRINGGPLVTP